MYTCNAPKIWCSSLVVSIASVRPSPTVLRMWLQTVKFIAKKSKCARLPQKIWFFCTKFVQLAVAGKWRNTVVHLQKKSVINWTWLRLSIFDWWIIMIGPGGFFLVVPMYLQFQLQFYWWGCPKNTAELRHFYYPDWHTEHRWRCSNPIPHRPSPKLSKILPPTLSP